MKKLILLLTIILLFSCSEKDLFITLSDSSVSMLYNDSKQLTINYSSNDLKNNTYVYTSSDPDVISVSNSGLVSGVSVGKALVTVKSTDGKYTDKCNFTITPKSTLYIEPYMIFGSTFANVESNETRSLTSQTSTALNYSDTNPNVIDVVYIFVNGLMTENGVVLTSSISNATEIVTFLYERYQYLGVTTSGIYTFKDRKTGNNIGMIVVTNGIEVFYFPQSSGSSIKDHLQNMNKVIVNSSYHLQLIK